MVSEGGEWVTIRIGPVFDPFHCDQNMYSIDFSFICMIYVLLIVIACCT